MVLDTVESFAVAMLLQSYTSLVPLVGAHPKSGVGFKGSNQNLNKAF